MPSLANSGSSTNAHGSLISGDASLLKPKGRLLHSQQTDPCPNHATVKLLETGRNYVAPIAVLLANTVACLKSYRVGKRVARHCPGTASSASPPLRAFAGRFCCWLGRGYCCRADGFSRSHSGKRVRDLLRRGLEMGLHRLENRMTVSGMLST